MPDTFRVFFGKQCFVRTLLSNCGTFLVGVHGAKKQKGRRKFGGLFASLPPERASTWFFDGLLVLRTTSDTPIEARTTGQLCDRQLAVVVMCLCWGLLCPALLFALVYAKPAVCSMV